jgi:hypothetical protein
MGNVGGPELILLLIVFAPIGIAIWAQMRWSKKRRSSSSTDNDPRPKR